jgi:capsular exopolysaccharide synthesis family protein
MLETIPEGHAPRATLTVNEFLGTLRRQAAVFLPVFAALLGLGLVAVTRMPSIYETSAKVLVPRSTTAGRVVDANNPIAPLISATQPDELYTQVQMLRSRGFIEEAGRRAGIPPRKHLERSVSVAAVPDTTVIGITVEGQNPTQIAALANAMIDLHTERLSQTQSTGETGTLAYVQQAKERAAGELAAAEQALVHFRQEHPIERLAARWSEQAKEDAERQSRVLRIERALTTTAARIAELEATLAKEPTDLIHVALRDNPLRARIEAKLQELRFERLDLVREFRPASRQVRDLDAQIAALGQKLASEPVSLTTRSYAPNPNRPLLQQRLVSLRTDMRGYQAELAALRARGGSRAPEAANPGSWEVQQSRLIYQRDAAQRALSAWSDRLQDLQTRSAVPGMSARVIDRAAVPTDPIRPRKLKYYIYCVLLALCVAAGAAFLRELMDGRMHTPVHVERATGLPQLGQIPALPLGSQPPLLVTAIPAQSRMGEAYRALRLSIGFDDADNPIRRLTVTSPAEDEGKTTTAMNLATALALDGKRVILVDADLRRPSISRRLDLPDAPGLSELLQGESGLDETLAATHVKDLSVLPAGSLPSNPAALFGSPAFEALVAELGERAEVVIFDTPPCLPVTDPLFVAARTDGVLLVVQVSKTKKDAIRCATELLSRARTVILGVVVSGVRDDEGDVRYRRYYGAAAEPLMDRHRAAAYQNGRKAEPTHPVMQASRSYKRGEGE